MRKVPKAVREVCAGQQPRAEDRPEDGGDTKAGGDAKFDQLIAKRTARHCKAKVDASYDAEKHRGEVERGGAGQQQVRRHGKQPEGDGGRDRRDPTNVAEFRASSLRVVTWALR